MGTEPEQSPSPDAVALAFRLALDAARAFVGATAPNPPVGCAILDASGNVLAVAAHQRAGTGHSEALAIAECRAKGLGRAIHTIVVTLEPCNHFGRTPPCSEAILSTTAKAVWIGAADPNPAVVGGGAERLRAAGLTVRSIGELDHGLAGSARRLLGPFAKRARTGLPWVTVKQAVDGSGSMIPARGQKTFTSQDSLKLAHELRRRADAVLTGSGTILADAPEFTVRHVPDFVSRNRHLAILDRRGRVSTNYIDAATARGFRVLLPYSLADALHQLGEAGALEVLVEAGPLLTENVLVSPFWDEHVRITADKDGPDRVEVLSQPHSFALTERS